MSKATLASVWSVLALALAALTATGCEPAVPANPTYEADVLPLFRARCIRCHDETFRGDPGEPTPTLCHLDRFLDSPECAVAGQPQLCLRGAQYCGTNPTGTGSLITAVTLVDPDASERMPPPPADPLSDWEKEVIRRWSTANPAER